MIPAQTIASRIRTRFEAESSVRWSDSALYAAMNEGLDELSEASSFREQTVSIPIIADRTFYDLRSYVPDDFISVRAAWSSVRNTWLDPITENSLYDRWEEAVGDPYSFFTRGWNWLGIFPRATGSVGYLRIYFSCLAPQFTHGQAVLSDLPDSFVPALEDYGLYDLQAQDGETDKALRYWKDFSARQKSFTDFVATRTRTTGFIGGAR